MSKHTPGPWSLAVDGREWMNMFQVEGPSGCCIVSLGPHGVYGESAEHDARLIAAAPELLEALVFLAIEVQDIRGVDVEAYKPAAFELARKAIAKATGEQTK